MKVKPILFSTPMVQALLDCRKTQTRRVIKSKHESGLFSVSRRVLNGQITGITSLDWDERPKNDCTNDIQPKCQAGDILWVRETWQQTFNPKTNIWDYIYKADGGVWFDEEGPTKWKPSIFMPRAAARIFLEVTEVKVELLNDISEDDAAAEGVLYEPSISGGVGYFDYSGSGPKGYNFDSARDSFKALWESINGPKSWGVNPYVFAYTFKQVDRPKGFMYGQ